METVIYFLKWRLSLPLLSKGGEFKSICTGMRCNLQSGGLRLASHVKKKIVLQKLRKICQNIVLATEHNLQWL